MLFQSREDAARLLAVSLSADYNNKKALVTAPAFLVEAYSNVRHAVTPEF
jgi:hypothetical protein